MDAGCGLGSDWSHTGSRLAFAGNLTTARTSHHITYHMENTEAGLQRPLFLRNRLKTTSI